MVKCSIVSVVLNCARVVEDTINSVIDQSYDDIDYIIIDGGSDDSTVNIIRKYEKKLSYWVSEPDSGIYDAMNKGLSHATGDIVCFLNAGDRFYDGNVLKRVCERFEDEPDTDVLICKEMIEGKVCKTYLDDDNKSIYFGSFFPHQATFVRTELYRKYRNFNEEYRICADYDWILGAYYNGFKIRWCDDVVAVYDSGGVSSGYMSIAEQYLISCKYLKLSNNKELLLEAGNHYISVFARTFFRDLIKRKEKSELIQKCLQELTDGKTVDIWGGGYIGRLLCDFFDENGMAVNRIYDSDETKTGAKIGKATVFGPDQLSSNMIIISTTDYEREVADLLEKAGRHKKQDYLTYTEISSFVSRYLIDKGYDDGGFVAKSGLSL